jgi:hypothetical protein
MHNFSYKNTIIFTAGVVTGTILVWSAFKKYWSSRANEEIESVKEAYKNTIYQAHDDVIKSVTIDISDLPDESALKKKMQTIMSSYGKDTESDNKPDSGRYPWGVNDKPYIIPESEFGSNEDYDTITLYYYIYHDVLTDENDEPIANVENVVGLEFASYLDEGEDNSVFVRNERLKCDFEILKDLSL